MNQKQQDIFAWRFNMAKLNNKKKTKPAHQLDPLNSTQKIKKGLALQKEGKLTFIKDVNKTDNLLTKEGFIKDYKSEITPEPRLINDTEFYDAYVELTNKISKLSEHINEYRALDNKYHNKQHEDLLNKYNNFKLKFYAFAALSVGTFVAVNLYNWFN